MTRRRGLIVTGLATLALFLAMAPADERMRDTGGPGIVPFELSGGESRADEILAEWGEAGQDAARESLWIEAHTRCSRRSSRAASSPCSRSRSPTWPPAWRCA